MRLFIFACMACLGAAPALGQEGLQKQLYGCATIANAGQRHACFDALVPELKRAGEATFGAPGGKPSPLTAPIATPTSPKGAATTVPPQANRVMLAVKSIGTTSDGKLRFTMENGQIWKQIDSERLRNLGSGPWTAEIRTAVMGSFLLTIDGGRAIRVQRVN